MKVYEQSTEHTNPWLFALQLGFFAGLIWGGIKVVLYYLEFTCILPGFMVEPFFRHKFLQSTMGILLGWGFFVLFSLLAAYIYLFLFRKWQGPWPGLGYGLLWWLIWFVWIGPVVQSSIKPIYEQSWDTITTELCLFLLWGLFIGYTISFEFNEERSEQ